MAATSHGSEPEDRDSNSEAEGSIQSYRSGHGTKKLRRVRMEFPRFSGEDPRVWLDRARKYFAAQDVDKEEHVRLATFHLEGEANQWWQWTATEGAGAKVVQPPPRANLGSTRRLTWEETQRRREQNLCFNCDEKFVHGHRCSGIKAMVIEVVEEDEGKAIEEPLTEETEHISIHALTGQGVEFKVTLYALSVIGVEVVLEVSWLEQLGPTVTDYKEMTMEFRTKGERHILRGAVPEGTRAVEARSVEQEVTLGTQLFMAVEARVNTVAEGGTGKRIAEVFIRGIVRLHGIPESVVMDRDRIFMSSFWRELFKFHGTKLKMSSAYHPQTDGQTEVINRCLEQYLRYFVYHQPRLWERYMAWAEYWNNTTYQRSIAMTPFEAVYGRPAQVLVGYEPGSTAVNEVEEQLRARNAILRELKSNLAAAQNRMKATVDKHRWDKEFEVGDWVVALVGTAAYRLDLPDYAKIHLVFHVSLLRRRVGKGQAVQPTLPPYESNSLPDLAPVDVRDYRWVAHGGGRTKEALVRWNALPDEDATWEPVEIFHWIKSPYRSVQSRQGLSGAVSPPLRCEGPTPFTSGYLFPPPEISVAFVRPA
ncbi:hypothetical protein CRG98_023062 [Punica granatum]|uniref:Integrase catalytic domain-containing protein n=1 Tax=Punica granatum TaxID=22663 RepID=A0A2I0JLY4_PUNGR|nr:hypothetical protein CRG98_023062 [Punica granatum]